MNEITSMYDSDVTIENSTETTPIKDKFLQINSKNNQLYDFIDDNIDFIDNYININNEININTIIDEIYDAENYTSELCR